MLPFDESAAKNISTTEATRRDADLLKVANWFYGQVDFEERIGEALRQSIDEVLDGQRTGRFDIANLEKTEKTYLGTKVEIVIRSAFGLQRGKVMDYVVAGQEVDSKFTSGNYWTIPGEAHGHICLLTSADDKSSRFRAGLVRIHHNLLNGGKNRDGKQSLSAQGRGSILWLTEAGQLPVNVLLSLPVDTCALITGHRNGQQRTNELFRHVQGQLIHRSTVLTVARQDDGLKRVRDARKHLSSEGIIILGHQGKHPGMASDLGLPVPASGSWIAARVVPVPSGSPRPHTTVGGKTYAIAMSSEGSRPGPTVY
ncbi:NaeI family type II restriction endonuclease [Streptantibioticus silvisoli]|uniref:NaeI family type II restriction endonuclease n=1 Tax=Streptantibioticus silvisoli TaxID=2705255 RepID=A0ABT6VVE0_9ACTN|nr:NaeI family type II restriction endonuclease [Streptantibioticus silvisoli]MDI5962110.1 NaeI family type II restriction endonuclease [Streptantibioticus silvisoli]